MPEANRPQPPGGHVGMATYGQQQQQPQHLHHHGRHGAQQQMGNSQPQQQPQQQQIPGAIFSPQTTAAIAKELLDTGKASCL